MYEYIDKLYIYIIICMYIVYLYSRQLTRCTPTWLMNQGWAGLWFKLESVGDLSLSLFGLNGLPTAVVKSDLYD